jgi:APA family basic amino acid/polyamine antiporter
LTGLRRSLGLLDATMANVGVIIGSAVFLTAGDVARALPQPLLQLGVWGLAALFSLAGALTIAELGAALPRAGGLCVYLHEAFGAFWGFLYGWSLLLVIQTSAIAAVAVAFASYGAHFVPLSPHGVELVAVAGIVALTAVNVLGVREGVWTQNAVTFAKLLVIGGLIALAFGKGSGSAANLWPAGRAWTLAGLGAAVIGPLFAFDGWITTSYIGGEVKEPGRNLPLSALLSIAIVAVVYLALNAAYLFVLGSEGVAASTLVATDTARALLGERGADVAAAMVLIATVGGLNGNILGGARVLYAMAQTGLFWRAAGHVHPRFGTPATALAVQGAISIAFVFTGRFEQLLASCLFASWVFYGLGGLAVFALRRRHDLERPYQVWGHPVVPAAFIAFAAVFLLMAVAADPRDTALGAALLLTGAPAYLFFKRRAAAHQLALRSSSARAPSPSTGGEK